MSSPHSGSRQPRSRARGAFLAGSLAALIAIGPGCAQLTGRPDVVIGTAAPVDVDYPLGGSICRLFNFDTPRHGLRCAEVASASPMENIESLRSGRIDIGIVPSDLLADAVAGVGPFASRRPESGLRVLFSGHADIFTLVVRRGGRSRRGRHHRANARTGGL